MPIIEVTLLEGRTPEAKEALVAALTDAAVSAVGAPIESVRVILREVPAAHFAVGGQSFAARRARESGG
ncbi:4-oxalocrotonate tautomerase [Sphingopyxis sp. H038]|jgi:4-oxalocrotonate tautomerase|uniref:Tautomerase n=2 Tax=Sphingopyxis TaxID=165697 RepID=A0A2S8B7J1_9SPHN|nr:MULTISPECIES: 2-hydroxymuconate tautomerase [Sphingopyxis]MBN8843089.1 2-hydroxymuconate tautomerase family protein [Sphingomonadales bacterium]MBU0877116.1 2-hydroxymuconate tautomerase family protein [Alphaproteobacteria bacterium]KGB52054.1 4-oxalocrotonoate tautomerase [Sphingopyxis sp. LC363]KTE00506.1 4-oxalocrotonate tautomerase [Sphingopyxis sp. H012]KTE08327.1 4-oxalocrotonate tautomerase [Sphingopyxis sp. H053]